MGSNEKCKLITISSISGFIKKDPIYRKVYLRDYLEKLEISHVLSWTYSGGLYLKKIKHFYKDVEQLKELFPTVFSKKHTRIKLRNSFWGKMLMKFFKVNYLEDELAGIKLMGIRCVDVCLILQVLLFIKEKEENSNLKLPLTTSFVRSKLGNGFKEFQLVDYIDIMYDNYKHTGILPGTFRELFKTFGVYTEEISNFAFDIFIKTRKSQKSWEEAISNFLSDKLNIEGKTKETLTAILLD